MNDSIFSEIFPCLASFFGVLMYFLLIQNITLCGRNLLEQNRNVKNDLFSLFLALTTTHTPHTPHAMLGEASAAPPSRRGPRYWTALKDIDGPFLLRDIVVHYHHGRRLLGRLITVMREWVVAGAPPAGPALLCEYRALPCSYPSLPYPAHTMLIPCPAYTLFCPAHTMLSVRCLGNWSRL